MIRVADLEASKQFYTEALGMKVLREKEYPSGQFTLCFIGYGDEDSNTVIELTYNWGRHSYDLGDGFGHIALGTDDIKSACEKVRALGYKVVRVVMKDGRPAGIEDFATGWLKNGVVSGRPAGLMTGADSALYISDDNKGFIYRVSYDR